MTQRLVGEARDNETNRQDRGCVELMTDALKTLTNAECAYLKPAVGAGWHEPMLATLTHDPFSNDDWIFERKLDGVRAIALQTDHGIELLSRNKQDLGRTYPELVEALSHIPGDFAIDGEIVTFDGKTSSFARLQDRMQVKSPSSALQARVPVFYYVFDITRRDGWDLRELPLRRRKSVLRNAISFEDPIRFCAHRNADGERYFREACEKGWEGLIAKKACSTYESRRSRAWLKFKCDHRQEFVIAGFTDPKGARDGFGALLLGYYQGDKLLYAGRVGTGFDSDFLKSFSARLRKAETTSPAFANSPRGKGDIHWTKPRFVGEVAFTEWTSDGKLRHPRFLGLRGDKSADEVVREDARPSR